MKINKGKEAADAPAIRVTVFESKPMFRKGLARVFEDIFTNPVISEAENTDDLSVLNKSGTPDYILIGLEVASEQKAIRQIPAIKIGFPKAKIILYSYQNELKMIPSLLKMGIHGYLMADFDGAELKQCLDTISKDKKYINNELVWAYLDQESTPSSENAIRLSKTEQIVADYLTKGMTVSQIARALNRQLSTISTLKAKVFKKMEVENVLDLKEKLQSYSNLSNPHD